MTKDGRVVSILNNDQVLVQIMTRDAFHIGAEFTVFTVVSLQVEQPDLPKSLEMPKPGRLIVEAIQSGSVHAILGVIKETRQKVVRRPSPLRPRCSA